MPIYSRKSIQLKDLHGNSVDSVDVFFLFCGRHCNHRTSWFHAFRSFALEQIIQKDDKSYPNTKIKLNHHYSNNRQCDDTIISIKSACFLCFLWNDKEEGCEISELWSEIYNYSCGTKISITSKKSKGMGLEQVPLTWTLGMHH